MVSVRSFSASLKCLFLVLIALFTSASGYGSTVTHTVTFDLGTHGSLLSGELVQQVVEGHSALAPDIRTTTGWSFVGWDRSYHNVTSAITVSAQYVPRDLVGVLEDSKLRETENFVYDRFGHSVSVSGDTAVIGAPEDVNYNGDHSGNAYVYVRSGGLWVEEAKLTASDGVFGDLFGVSVSVCGDTAVVGARSDAGNGNESGSVYVFVRSNGVWVEQTKLVAIDGLAGDNFGLSVSVDNDTLVVGAPFSNIGGVDSGRVYVYVRRDGIWNAQSTLTAGDAASHDYFVYSVSVSGDTVLIGAYGDDDKSGSAYVYIRSGACGPSSRK